MFQPKSKFLIRSMLWFGTLLLLYGCEVKPQEIHYGADGCSFCKMTIVDTQHAAQIVTTKGKSFKYDAIECMLNHMKGWDQAPIKYHLVTDYSQPKHLVDATKAQYLISQAIPSPMGAFLTAFRDEQNREDVRLKEGGEAHAWESILKKFNLKE